MEGSSWETGPVVELALDGAMALGDLPLGCFALDCFALGCRAES
jgi:hypothetical protein